VLLLCNKFNEEMDGACSMRRGTRKKYIKKSSCSLNLKGSVYASHMGGSYLNGIFKKEGCDLGSSGSEYTPVTDIVNLVKKLRVRPTRKTAKSSTI
jgi:hypothetical protein